MPPSISFNLSFNSINLTGRVSSWKTSTTFSKNSHFAGGRDCDRPMAHSGLLKRDRLDYTVASLETVDEYLKYLHEHWHGQTGGEWDRAVLWGGAYVGEVIRRYAVRSHKFRAARIGE